MTKHKRQPKCGQNVAKEWVSKTDKSIFFKFYLDQYAAFLIRVLNP